MKQSFVSVYIKVVQEWGQYKCTDRNGAAECIWC